MGQKEPEKEWRTLLGSCPVRGPDCGVEAAGWPTEARVLGPSPHPAAPDAGPRGFR